MKHSEFRYNVVLRAFELSFQELLVLFRLLLLDIKDNTLRWRWQNGVRLSIFEMPVENHFHSCFSPQQFFSEDLVPLPPFRIVGRDIQLQIKFACVR